jgi:thiol:disulfide interchange protein DsbC
VAHLIRLSTSTLLLGIIASIALAAESIDFDKALKIGSGKITVIEFTDPDCPYCRKAYQYFLTRSDVTLYIFFNPLSSHHNARKKAQYILSSDDRERAYAEVMAGLFDSVSPSGITEKGKKLLEEQTAIANKLGINEVPIFMIFGRIVKGFDQKILDQLLSR